TAMTAPRAPLPAPKPTPPPPAPMPPVQPVAAPAPAPVPMPAPVVPGAAKPKLSELDAHLLAQAQGDGPVEVRKSCIQALVTHKVNTPEVMAGLEQLSD